MNPNWPLVLRQIITSTNCEVQDIAAHCGVCKSAVEQWLAGVKSPNFEHGWAVLNAYVSNVSRRIPQS
jgi:hypothetical protein